MTVDISYPTPCNPTTWRRDLVMPALETAGITFYNPQVDDWYPELMELESRAKEQAQILFFVIDAQTRAIASLIEVAYLSTMKPEQVVLVINKMAKSGCEIGGKKIADAECKLLSDGRAFLRDIAKKEGVVVFEDIQEALKAVIRKFKKTGNSPKTPLSSVKEKVARLWRLQASPGRPLNVAILRDAYSVLSNGQMSVNLVNRLVECFQRGGVHSGIEYRSLEEKTRLEKITVDFDPACCLETVSGLKTSRVRVALRAPEKGSGIYLTIMIGSFEKKMVVDKVKELFKKHSSPVANLQTLTDFNNQPMNLRNWLSVKSRKCSSTFTKCSTFLVILVSNRQPDLSYMIAAANAVGMNGKGFNLLLMLQNLDPARPLKIEGDVTLDSVAIKDYNRGRAYLRDVAKEKGVSTFDEVEKTLEAAVVGLKFKP